MSIRPDNESRMDDELSRQGDYADALERWIDDPGNQEIAESITWGWSELKHSFEAAFPNCELEDEMSISEVGERFKVRRQR